MSNLHIGFKCLEGTVDHSSSLSHDIGALFLNDEYSDVTLEVNGQKFYAHKVILAARSLYFSALLYGGLKETKQEVVEIKGASLNSFKILLKYIYTGLVNLATEKEEVVLDILGLAHQYGFEELEGAVCDYLKEALCCNNEEVVLDILGLAHQYGFEELEGAVCDYLKEALCCNNVCTIYDMASLYNLKSLSSVCEEFIDKNAVSVLSHESFVTISAAALKSIIKRDSFCASEVQIFQGVNEWYKHNKEISQDQLDEAISFIRLPLISLTDLLNIVRPTGLLSPDALLDAIKTKNEFKDTDLQYRGYLMPGENVAVSSKDAVVLQGEMKTNLLDGNVTQYDMDRGFTRHPIDDNNGQGILIKLSRQCIINHMRMLLWDKDHRAYSYFIEVSMDQKDWVRIIDYTMYHCRSWQFLYFDPRVVRFIKIVGTNNTINRVFHVVAFEAYYVKQEFTLHKGIIVPKENVALVSKSAKVIEGVSRARNNLLNCDIHHYDWDSGYTCHQLGSGAICIQLGQPYWLSSCKLLLWNCDERSYSFYIESSVNGREWVVIADKTREPCQAWQTLTFTPRPIVYFKLIGTFNSANEVFHCVHFECPAQTGSEEIRTKLATNGELRAADVTTLSQQPRGLDLNEAPMRPQRVHDPSDPEENDDEREGRWMGAGDGPPSDRSQERAHNSPGGSQHEECAQEAPQ